jgi:hypothetical protein
LNLGSGLQFVPEPSAVSISALATILGVASRFRKSRKLGG